MSLLVRCCLSAAVLTTALLAQPALSQPRLPLERSHDYIVPTSSQIQTRARAVKVLGGKQAFGSSERVSYVGFDNKTYELNRFHGLHVDILLPDAWLGPQALSEEQARHFVDRTDLMYQYYLDLIGQEPAGDGPLPIAILPEVCGGALGCGWVGLKGIEMADVPEYRSYYWQEIATDSPSGVLVHELVHNFDVFSPYLSYVADGSHGWTNFITNYYFAFSHEGIEDESPDDFIQYALNYTSFYFRDPAATWESCVRDDQCEDRYILPNNTYGGFGLRIALRHGPQTVRGFSSFLRQYEQSHEPPQTAEEKNDLYVEALAAGAHLNLSCVADFWRWPVSDALRQRMKQRYGTRNPDCEDQDHDHFTPLQGDCDDHLSAVHPGALERPNHLDDNCDGAVDEVLYRGGGGASEEDPRSLPVPAEAHGAVGLQADFYQIQLRSPQRIRIALCYGPEIYGQVALSQGTTYLHQLEVFGGCNHQSFSLDQGDWGLRVGLGSDTPVEYTMEVSKATPWPSPPWARTASPTAERESIHPHRSDGALPPPEPAPGSAVLGERPGLCGDGALQPRRLLRLDPAGRRRSGGRGAHLPGAGAGGRRAGVRGHSATGVRVGGRPNPHPRPLSQPLPPSLTGRGEKDGRKKPSHGGPPSSPGAGGREGSGEEGRGDEGLPNTPYRYPARSRSRIASGAIPRTSRRSPCFLDCGSMLSM